MERRWLSRELVERQQERGLMLAYYAREGGRDYVAVDVDDHEDGGWKGGAPTERLRQKAKDMVERMGQEPSVAFATPRGVHLYWFVTRVVPEDVIVRVMKERVDGIAEHRPTVKDALRVPDAARCVNGTLEPVGFGGFGAVKRWNPEEVLGVDCEMRPRTVEDLRSRYRRVLEEEVEGNGRGAGAGSWEGPRVPEGRGVATDKLMRAEGTGTIVDVGKRAAGSGMAGIEAEENAVVPFRDHQTNQVYSHLAGVYFAAGMTPTEAIERFEDLIQRSPGYTGSLSDELEKRVASSYANMVRGNPKANKETDWDKLMENVEAKEVVASIIDAAGLPEGDRRRGPLEELVWSLWRRKLINDWIASDPVRLEGQDRRFRGYRELMRQGYYPVSAQELHDWNCRYRPYVELLVKAGVMLSSGRKARPGGCRYYALRIAAFKVLRHSMSLVGRLTVTRVDGAVVLGV